MIEFSFPCMILNLIVKRLFDADKKGKMSREREKKSRLLFVPFATSTVKMHVDSHLHEIQRVGT